MYAECLENKVDDSWTRNPESTTWRSFGTDSEPKVSLESWCQAPVWSRINKIHVRRAFFVPRTTRHEFARLLSQWKIATAFTSSDTEVVLHPAYQRIIGMGEKALPMIFEEMEKNGGNWFWALRHITGENPVSNEDVGRSKKMKEVWLKWGRERHYL